MYNVHGSMIKSCLLRILSSSKLKKPYKQGTFHSGPCFSFQHFCSNTKHNLRFAWDGRKQLCSCSYYWAITIPRCWFCASHFSCVLHLMAYLEFLFHSNHFLNLKSSFLLWQFQLERWVWKKVFTEKLKVKSVLFCKQCLNYHLLPITAQLIR